MNMHVVNNESTVLKNTGKVNICYHCLELNMTFHHYGQTFHIQVLKVFFLFVLNVQASEATKLKSAASLIVFVCCILLPVICLRGTKTLSPEGQ